MTIKYGVIGCGMMGMEHLRNIALLEGARVTAVCDPSSVQRDMAQHHTPSAKAYDSLAELLDHGDVDALVIASPNHLHVRQLEAIAARKTVPILCEKPLFTRPEDVSQIARLQQAYGAPIWVAMEYRYMPPIAALIDQADSVTGGVKMLTLQEHRFPFLPKIGDWNRFNAQTGGTFVEKCCHFFDLMRLILKSEPVRVTASAAQFVNHLDETYDGKTPDIWDAGYVIFDFDNGAKAMLELAMFVDGTKWNEEIHAIGPMGKIACRLPGPQRFWPKELGPSPHPELSVYPRAPKRPHTDIIKLDETLVEAGDHHGATFYQHQKFLDMVRRGGRPEVSLEDGRRAVQMGLMAQQAARTGQVIRLDQTVEPI